MLSWQHVTSIMLYILFPSLVSNIDKSCWIETREVFLLIKFKVIAIKYGSFFLNLSIDFAKCAFHVFHRWLIIYIWHEANNIRFTWHNTRLASENQLLRMKIKYAEIAYSLFGAPVKNVSFMYGRQYYWWLIIPFGEMNIIWKGRL